MVVFTCNNCGESLQKPKVDKHYQFSCRAGKNLTCVDCFKDFKGEEYVAHNKCVTEEERYSARGSLPNGIVKKGEVKQESWVEMIKSILNKEANMRPVHRNLFDAIANSSNVPRKKPKFINFVKSSSGGRARMEDIEAVWEIIEKYKSAHSNSTIKTNGQVKNGSSEENGTNGKNKDNGCEKEPVKEKKRKHSETAEEKSTTEVDEKTEGSTKPKKTKKKKLSADAENNTENGITAENGKHKEEIFSFEDAILNILQEKPSISLGKLEKKFLKSYKKHFGGVENLEKVSRKFNKKLKKIENVNLTDDRVNLAQK